MEMDTNKWMKKTDYINYGKGRDKLIEEHNSKCNTQR